jgi:O-antigen/teichoic acid export membrane protein
METSTAVPERRAAPDAHSAADVADTLSDWTVGGGMITMALFPLALPIIALTAVALLPLVVPVLAIGLLAAVVALPILAARAVGRGLRKGRGRTHTAEQAPTPAHRGM